VGGGGYGVLGLRQINTGGKVPLQLFTGQFLKMATLCIVFYESYLSTVTRTTGYPHLIGPGSRSQVEQIRQQGFQPTCSASCGKQIKNEGFTEPVQFSNGSSGAKT
jgi:hypothetical protein